MANTPKKAKDPTEAAMSAIQEALNVRDAEMKATPARPAAMRPAAAQPNLAPPVAAPTPAPERRAPRAAPAPSDDDLFDPTRGDGAEPGRPANDDWKSVGQMLQTLQPRSSRTAYVVASIASAVWVAGLVVVASAMMPDPRENFLALVALAFGAVVPVVFFYLLAITVNRSREMRLIAQSMAEVAMRLAEPEAVARESIVTVGQAIRREVAAMGDGVERALARAAELEALVHSEVSALERAYNDNEVRIRGLLEDLAHQRDNLVGQAEQVRNAITSVHLDLNQDITGISDMVAQQVNVAAQQITQTLAEKGEHITLALGRAGDTMIEALGERGGDLLERLERTNLETTHAIASATQQLTDNLDAKTDAAVDAISVAAQQLTSNLDSRTDQAMAAISAASEQLTQSLDFKTDSIPQEFEMLADNMSQMMQLRMANVTNDFDQRSNALVEMMADRSQQITAGLIDMSSQVAEAIATRGDEVNSTIKATGDSLVLDLSLRGGDVVSQIEQTGTKISDTISSRLASFEEMFTHGAAELTEKVSHDSSTLGNLIIRHIGEFDRTVKTFGGELVERLGERTQTVTDAMKNYVENFGEKVGAKATEVNETLDQRLLRFQEALDSRTQTLNDNMTSRVMDIAKTLAEGGKEVVSALDQRIGDVSTTINSRGEKVAEAIASKTEEIDRALGQRALEIANNLDSRLVKFEELLLGRTDAAAKQIEDRAHAAAAAVTATSEQVRNSTQELERVLTTVSGGITSALKQNASEVERTLLGVGAEVARGFVGKADEIAAAIAERAAEMTRVLDADSSTLLTALSSKSSEFTGEVNRATQEAVNAIEAKGFDFTRTMLDNSGELARQINEAGENATRKVNETLTSLQDTAKMAVTQSQETAAGAVKDMLEAHNTLRTDTTGLFERLREANILLQEVLTGAHENMGALENTLTNRVQEFAAVLNDVTDRNNAATERVSVHVDAFRGETSRVLGDLSELATQFESHGRVLVEAVDLIEKSNRRTEDSLADRRSSLDALSATLDLSSQDLEQRLTRFASLLDESLENATARAREIGRMIAETTSTGSTSITEQFEQVRKNTEEERERTTQSLQTIYERATGDSQAMFRQTAEQFADTLSGMKQMASDMQRELESTRTELRRGILELPQETAENAAQMRRVIVDQIEALAELNSIVARHGKTMEAETRRAPAEPMLAVVGGGRNEAQPAPRPGRPDMPPPAMAQRQPGPRQPAQPMAPTPPPGAMQDSPPLTPPQGQHHAQHPGHPAQQPGPLPAQPPVQNRGGQGAPGGPAGSGWLTDLLHRADETGGGEPAPIDGSPPAPRDPRARPPAGGGRRGPIDSLDALSVDIARMVDHDVSAQMWDRYNRGERNVFSRQLYTPQGQRAFDDIRHRYRGNREFRQTVDRYIGEFERLLEEVSRDERGGQQMVRTYLTSETGKVYTLLAHAAGRFD